MGLSPEQQLLADRVEADIEARVERRLRRRSWIRALGYAVFVVVLTFAGWLIVRHEVIAACESRQSARADLRNVLSLALEGKDPNDPRLAEWFHAIGPGGTFGPIDC